MAGPMGQMKDLYKLQKEAKQMQKELREVMISGMSKDGRVKLLMNAAQEFVDIDIDESLLDEYEMDNLKRCIKEAYTDYQKALQKQMLKQFDMNKLRGMLGN